MMKSTNKKPPALMPVQAKSPNGVINQKRPVAPSVYHPQPALKVVLTKYPSGHTLQKDHAPLQPVAPPVYRPEVKKAVQLKTILPQRKSPTPPPVYRPEQKRALQAKTVSGAKAHTPFGYHQQIGMGPRNSFVIQRAKRKHLEDKRETPAASVPDLEMKRYKEHVEARTVYFFQQVLGTALTVINKGGTVSPALFTDHARVQVQSGLRLKGTETVAGEKKWDAAHLMNTSLNPVEYAKQTYQKEEDEDVQHRLLGTAATLNQFQKANVSADKIIDSQQTITKNSMLEQLKAGTPLDKKFVRIILEKYLSTLKDTLTGKALKHAGKGIKGASYAAALEVITSQHSRLDHIMRNIENDLEVDLG